MNPRPRTVVAAALGLGSATLLLALLLREGSLSSWGRLSEPPVIVTTGTVNAGDTLARILSRHQIPSPVGYQIEKTFASFGKKEFDLRNAIYEGRPYELVTSTDGIFKKFAYHKNGIQTFAVTRSSVGVYDKFKEELKTVWMERRISGRVTESMYKDLARAGLEPSLVDVLVVELCDDILAWRIDFFTEQRPGDEFTVLLEQQYALGSDTPIRGSDHMRVLAASYNGKGTRKKENLALLYEPPAGKAEYYDMDGEAVRKAFRRAPFRFGAFRVSSGYNPKRFHPILRTYRPHHGTDYAAARGTPVVAVGKGKVVRASWYKGYGNCVDVQHNSRYTSRYGHLSRISVRFGQSVEEGRIIGNVGSTGLSTGPHLHFEMLLDGKQRNFLRMEFPSTSGVAKSNMDDFKRVRDQLLARLNAPATELARK